MARKRTLLAGEEPTGEEVNNEPTGEETPVTGEPTEPTEPVEEPSEPTPTEPVPGEPQVEPEPTTPPADPEPKPDTPAEEEKKEEDKRFFETFACGKSLYPVQVMRRRRRSQG